MNWILNRTRRYFSMRKRGPLLTNNMSEDYSSRARYLDCEGIVDGLNPIEYPHRPDGIMFGVVSDEDANLLVPPQFVKTTIREDGRAADSLSFDFIVLCLLKEVKMLKERVSILEKKETHI